MHIDSLQSKEDMKKSESQVVDVSLTMESNEEENYYTNILQEEYNKEPCASEDLVAYDKFVDNMGGEFTSSFFVGDFQITVKGIDFAKGDEK